MKTFTLELYPVYHEREGYPLTYWFSTIEHSKEDYRRTSAIMAGNFDVRDIPYWKGSKMSRMNSFELGNCAGRRLLMDFIRDSIRMGFDLNTIIHKGI